jgi:hypothetical protein
LYRETGGAQRRNAAAGGTPGALVAMSAGLGPEFRAYRRSATAFDVGLDCFFAASTPHGYRRLSRGPATAIVVTTA